MPVFLDPTGNSTYGIGICQRCSRKFFLHELHSDPNTPGLKVCIDDLDDYDPYRLAPRQADRITLPFYRPDQDLTPGGPNPNPISLFGVREAIGESPRETEDGRLRVLEAETVNQDEVDLDA
jgi:hypothetical protein